MAFKNEQSKVQRRPELWGGTAWENFKTDVDSAVEVLKQGGLILYPTDTVWGLGCDATNEQAVQRVFKLKQRDDSKSLIVLVDTESKIEHYVSEVADVAWDIIRLALRPTTVVFDGARNLAPSVVAADGSVGIRLTTEAYSRELCRRLGRAVVSTSANVSGQKAPSFFNKIQQEIRDGVDYIAAYRRRDHTPALPSQIIHIGPHGESKVIRL